MNSRVVLVYRKGASDFSNPPHWRGSLRPQQKNQVKPNAVHDATMTLATWAQREEYCKNSESIWIMASFPRESSPKA